MPNTGHSWEIRLPAQGARAAELRQWIRNRLTDSTATGLPPTIPGTSEARSAKVEDLVQIGSELFALVSPTAVAHLTLSTAGHRIRITARQPRAFTIPQVTRRIIADLAQSTGDADDQHTVWAELDLPGDTP
ncbi:hypothetical protein ACFW1A_23870 [Kitasatospora sp. NPDC058965]|uniref:hypothetical protein n=1 Tax=Kitasatospora sp. NPDC058965 TaxID=3346682 RepID=UPI00369AE199